MTNRDFDPRLLSELIVMDTKDPETWKTVARYQLIYSVGGLFVGTICVLGGVVLFLHGVVGKTSWTAKFLGAQSVISDAAPGAVLFIVGLFAIFVTRFVVKSRR